MTCSDARDAMLVADGADLELAGSGALSTHLAGCRSCRAAAAAIVETVSGLGPIVARRRVVLRRRRVALVAALPLAAAVVFAVVYARGSARRNESLRKEAFAATPTVAVEAAPGQRATVIKTADPKVTLVWFTPGAGE